MINVETSTNTELLASAEITLLVFVPKTLECSHLGLLVALSNSHTLSFIEFPQLKMVFSLCFVVML